MAARWTGGLQRGARASGSKPLPWGAVGGGRWAVGSGRGTRDGGVGGVPWRRACAGAKRSQRFFEDRMRVRRYYRVRCAAAGSAFSRAVVRAHEATALARMIHRRGAEAAEKARYAKGLSRLRLTNKPRRLPSSQKAICCWLCVLRASAVSLEFSGLARTAAPRSAGSDRGLRCVWRGSEPGPALGCRSLRDRRGAALPGAEQSHWSAPNEAKVVSGRAARLRRARSSPAGVRRVRAGGRDQIAPEF